MAVDKKRNLLIHDAPDKPAAIGDESKPDPRTALAEWANQKDEWIRQIARLVLQSGQGLTESDISRVYELFRQEQAIDERRLPPEPSLEVRSDTTEYEAPLEILTISDVHGVNALKSGSTIQFSPGLTILYGENGTGKTGYARILKALANSRTADKVLPDIFDPVVQEPNVIATYKLGDDEQKFVWKGEMGQLPFTRISVFDTPAITFHIDEDLTYVYTPASLAIFNHVSTALQGVRTRIDADVTELNRRATNLLSQFERGSSIYPSIESLGAFTDLATLEPLTKVSPSIDNDIKDLELAVAALQVNVMPQTIAILNRTDRVLNECIRFLTRLTDYDGSVYNKALERRAELQRDYTAFREELFASAHLPTALEETWEQFVRSGQAYRDHLKSEGMYDDGRCLYCLQPLNTDATILLSKYSDYLADKIAAEIRDTEALLRSVSQPIVESEFTETALFLQQNPTEIEVADLSLAREVWTVAIQLQEQLKGGHTVDLDQIASIRGRDAQLDAISATLQEKIRDLQQQVATRDQSLRAKQAELRELRTRLTLKQVWPEVVKQVQCAKEANKLSTLSAQPIPQVVRQVTELSKRASAQLINANFGKLFEEESKILRAPNLQLEFVGRQGRVQRRKVLEGNYKPSKVLSEGEQKVLALADFLAEARLTGITAPIVFDDPVSSLDHRRVQEVANRIHLLAKTNQVIVFTHDILFTTSLLSRFENSDRCTYLSVTDEDGKGIITRASGPRWDTIKNLAARVNETIQLAKTQQGDDRAASVRTGYSHIRAWCEVFVERELLAQVTERYQPNVRMTLLANIKPLALPDAIATVSRVFEVACRFIDGHSQPLPVLDVGPTLPGLEDDWKTLIDCRKKYLAS